MQCVHPFYLRKEHMYVPCGHCVACRIAKSREWSIRLLGELNYWISACFLTLTYDELHVPLSLKKRDLQLFWKRLRKVVEPRKIKYFSCGEYGEIYGRPHYHAIVFGVDWNDEDVIDKCWNKGFIKVGGVTAKSISYVTSYVMKKWSKDEEKKQYEEIGMEAPFQLVSRGLGLQFALDNHVQLQDDLGTTFNGKRVGLPRYYVRKLDIDTDIMREISKSANAEKVARICRRLGTEQYGHRADMYDYQTAKGDYLFNDKFSVYLRQELKQKERNMLSKERFRKGKF